jgi:hypothetical protein
MPNYPRRRRAVRKPRQSTKSRARKVSKPLRAAIKSVVKQQIETKCINVPDPTSGLLPTNTINRQYLSASGVQYLVQDVFRCPQGVSDDTQLASGVRLGDSIEALGFKMNYYFHTRNVFTVGGQTIQIPFIKMRVIAFTTAYGINPLIYSQLYDTNFVNVSSYTLHPVNRDEGYVKKVLYDKTFIVRNSVDLPVDNVSTPNTQAIYGNVMHFQKYIKFHHKLKYMDNNSTNPSGCSQPIYIAITAEADDSLSGFPPSDTPLVYTTGFTQAWFKDA